MAGKNHAVSQPHHVPYRVLPVIAFSQFAGTSLWFAPNAVVSEIPTFGTFETSLLTSLVQIGFIAGTLLISFLSIADRFPAAKVFALCGIIGSGLNLICIVTTNFAVWSVLRLLIGACLAGIYPVGLKVASQWYRNGLGFRLGVLVGALTLGTAFPWLLRGIGGSSDQVSMPVDVTLITVSALAAVGAILLPCLAYPPELGGKQVSKPKVGLSAFRQIWQESAFRAAALGYFGHMWELYALWAFLPVLIRAHEETWKGRADPVLNVELTTFITIGVGGLGCLAAGFLSLYVPSPQVPGSAFAAFMALFTSMICCFIAPLSSLMPPVVFFLYLLVWGTTVVADSGQFSSLCAVSAPPELLGTALTLSTCIGFTISVISILTLLAVGDIDGLDPGIALLVLAPGPVFGCVATYLKWPIHRACDKEAAVQDEQSSSSTETVEKQNEIEIA